MRALSCSALVCLLLSLSPAATAEAFLTPPVDAAVVSRFDDPPHPYGSGHRGIDYAIPEGSSVRAAGDGTVTFAGVIAGGAAVTIDHGAGLETTYTWLSEVFVQEGDVVDERVWIGRSGDAHGDSVPGLHFAVKVNGTYVDPVKHLGPLDNAGAIALAPLVHEPIEDRHKRVCKPSGALPGDAPPPNDNVAVLIGGITSATDGSGGEPDLFGSVPALGYSAAKTYRFSYRGTDGPAFHDPYSRADTFGDIRGAAARLKELMAEIERVHPGTEVDILAHSQGGIVGRTYLTEQAGSWDPSLPRVEHFVTFASPHQGVPAAAEIDELREGPLLSRKLADGVDELALRGFAVPPPDSTAVHQLRVSSELLDSLAAQDVLFGTRVLALAIPNDLLVPVPRAALPGKPARTVPAKGLWGHSEIVKSPRALQIAHAFLAGAGPGCRPDLNLLESHAGAYVDRGQHLIGETVNALARIVTPF